MRCGCSARAAGGHESHYPEGDDSGALHAHDLHAVTKSFEQLFAYRYAGGGGARLVAVNTPGRP